MRLLTIALIILLSVTYADNFYPVPGWVEQPDPAAAPAEALASPVLTQFLGPSPKSLNYYLDNNTMSAQVFGLLYESLLSRDPATLEYIPQLANRWSISDDRKTFTFWLDPNARWSDGHPITAQDVIWTYDTLLDPRNLTGPIRYSLERLERPEITEDGGIRFHAKSLHWENLSAASGFSILPKHAYENQDFNLLNFEFPVVSGPYRIKEFQEGICLVLAKRPDWWRAAYPAARGLYNFRELRMRFFEDQQNAFDAFKKGEIDLMSIYTASQWHGIEDAVAAVRNHMRFAAVHAMKKAKWMRMIADPNFPVELELHRLDCIACHGLLENYVLMLDRMAEYAKLPAPRKPFLNGNDIIALGVKPGAVFSRILSEAEDLRLEGELKSREQSLAWLRARVEHLDL